MWTEREKGCGGSYLYLLNGCEIGMSKNTYIAWDKASVFSYVVDEFIVNDFSLPFGWRSSPGWWGLMSAAITHYHRNNVVDTRGDLFIVV